MDLLKEQIEGLGIALNEATLLGVQLDPAKRYVGITFDVLSIPEGDSALEDRRVQFLLYPVGRICASLKNGPADDETAESIKFSEDELLRVVQSFGGLAIYGWEFIDVADTQFAQWSMNPSLDFATGIDAFDHHITLFQDGNERNLDMRIWFNDFQIRNSSGNEISIDNFITGGKRWWDGLSKGDSRTEGFGIFPSKHDSSDIDKITEGIDKQLNCNPTQAIAGRKSLGSKLRSILFGK